MKKNLQEFDGCKVCIEIMALEVENLFGLWKDHGDELSPSEVVRHLREGRCLRRSFGMAKGKLHYPDDIDFCNNEIAEMFGVDGKGDKGI